VKAPGRGCGKACQVDEGVRARGFLRLNMGTRTTPRHERALTDAAPDSHVWAAGAGWRAGGGWRRRWKRASTARSEEDGDSRGRSVELGGLLISRGVLRGRGVAVVWWGTGHVCPQTTTETRRSGRTYRGRGQQTRFTASSMEAEAQTAGPNAMPGRIESVLMLWLGGLHVAHRTGGS
jgi:hypothetical protein